MRALALLLTLFLAMPAPGSAAEPLVVGTKPSPPFIVLDDPDGPPSGLTVKLVENVAAALGRPVEWRVMGLTEMLEGVAAGRLDMAAGAITVTAERERRIDFSHAYYTTGLGIAVRGTGAGNGSLLAAITSPAFAKPVLSLLGLMMAVGLAIWLLERRSNGQDFGGDPLPGIGNGIWWSAVTMSTVGYGDKVPRTAAGRILGVVWIFASVVMISSFTASIASSLTVTRLEGTIHGPRDLPKVVTGTVPGSVSAKYLEENSLRRKNFPDLPAALEALARGEVDAVVYDAPLLRYYTARREQCDLTVLDILFARQNYALALPLHSPLRKEVNGAVLTTLSSAQWQEQLGRWLQEF